MTFSAPMYNFRTFQVLKTENIKFHDFSVLFRTSGNPDVSTSPSSTGVLTLISRCLAVGRTPLNSVVPVSHSPTNNHTTFSHVVTVRCKWISVQSVSEPHPNPIQILYNQHTHTHTNTKTGNEASYRHRTVDGVLMAPHQLSL